MNIISNPDVNNKYQATNILSETKKKPKIKEIIDLLINSYAKFFVDLNSYLNYISDHRPVFLSLCDSEYDECNVCGGDGTTCLSINNELIPEYNYDSAKLKIGTSKFVVKLKILLYRIN